ncbi:MAG: hypothetical protein WDZ30_10250 [Cellvibrionaceae bacterium]
MTFKIPVSLSHTLVASLVTTVFSGMAFAQEPAQPGSAQGQASIEQKAQRVQSQLIEIQREALEENPELRDQGEALEALITATMEEQGATPEADTQRLQEWQQQAQSPDVDQAERQEMAAEFQQLQQDLIRARQMAAEDEEVQTKQAEFQTAMLQAMQDQDPRTEELLAEMREIQLQQQRQLQQQFQQQGEQQSQGQQPAQ